MPNKELLMIALPIAKRIKKSWQDYNEERAKGWVNYCKHGTYIGDPYGADYLCGYCEDSREWTAYQLALIEAGRIYQARLKRRDVLFAAIGAGIDTHSELYRDLVEWTFSG